MSEHELDEGTKYEGNPLRDNEAIDSWSGNDNPDYDLSLGFITGPSVGFFEAMEDRGYQLVNANVVHVNDQLRLGTPTAIADNLLEDVRDELRDEQIGNIAYKMTEGSFGREVVYDFVKEEKSI